MHGVVLQNSMISVTSRSPEREPPPHLRHLLRRQVARLSCRSSRKSLAVSSSSSIALTAASSEAPATTGPWLASSTAWCLPASLPHRLRQRRIARRIVGDQRQRADAHDVVGGDRRQHVVGIDVGEARDRDRMGRVQMHDRLRRRAARDTWPGAGTLSLVGASPESSRPLIVEPREPRRIEPAERDVGRRHQPAVVEPRR